MPEHSPNKPTAIEASEFTPLDKSVSDEPARSGSRRIVLVAVLALFTVAMFFLLSARSVLLDVRAETPADISVSGLALPFGGRYLMRPGSYEVSVSAEGYHHLETAVNIDERDTQTIELLLQALPGRLSINSEPSGATVVLNGEAVGRTPLADLQVEPGEHQLRLQEARYLPLEQDLQITGRNVQQTLQLKLLPAWADVSVDSEPAGAAILVDGEAAGVTPATLEIMQGERQLMLQLASYADWQQTLELSPQQNVDLGRIDLQPAAGELQLSSKPSGANVTLDGEFQGQTPLVLQLQPDKAQRLGVSRPGYRRYNDTVQLRAGASEARTVELKAQLGEVRFRISPDTAVLRINGKSYGKGSRTLSLPAVEHSVEVSLAGYASVRRRVTPRQGLDQLLDVTLQTQQEARMARIKPEITTALGQTLLLFDPAQSPLSEFSMGASRREPGRRSNEVLHPVALRRMFYLQTTEVTNAQFRLYQGNHKSGHIEGNTLNRDHQPAVQLSWQQAASFCNWLSRKEGLPPFYREQQGIVTGFNPAATGYRLPSEAEWAWAARASGKTWLKFTWGEKFPPTDPVENYADNTSAYVTGRVLNGYADGHVVSAPVASYGPNHHGLHDMGGNVAEWVHDVYSIPSASGAPRTDPLGGQSGDNYVIRGASWSHAKLAELRLAYRDYGQAGRDDVGFRLARYAE